MLLTILPWAMFANGWLAVKVGLLVVYVVLGTFALRRARSVRARVLVFYVAALLTYGWMLTDRARPPSARGPAAAAGCSRGHLARWPHPIASGLTCISAAHAALITLDLPHRPTEKA